jgi:hypothetical protein
MKETVAVCHRVVMDNKVVMVDSRVVMVGSRATGDSKASMKIMDNKTEDMVVSRDMADNKGMDNKVVTDNKVETGDNKVVSVDTVVMARVDTENRAVTGDNKASKEADMVSRAVMATRVATGAARAATGATRVAGASRAAVAMDRRITEAWVVMASGMVKTTMKTKTNPGCVACREDMAARKKKIMKTNII